MNPFILSAQLMWNTKSFTLKITIINPPPTYVFVWKIPFHPN